MKDTIIKNEDVLWNMHWGEGTYPNKPAIEEIFEASIAAARLLAEEVMFLNNHWWLDSWPEDAKKSTSMNVNCNDVFAWGCADAEEVYITELEDLYKHWLKDPGWGPAVWCCKKRNEMPQSPVYKAIQEAGIWNLDELGLKPNYYDEAVKQRNAKS